MYWQKENSRLVPENEGPELIPTEEFERVLSTTPEDYLIQLPLIKFGLLMEHLEPAEDSVEISVTEKEIEYSSPAVVLPETLSQVEYLVANHGDHLDQQQKEKVGKLCRKTNLDLANDLGATKSEIEESNKSIDYGELNNVSYVCSHCEKEFDSKPSLNGHLGTCGTVKDTSNSSGSEKFDCLYCDKEFNYQKAKEMHMRKCDKDPNNSNSSDDTSSKKRPASGKEIKKDRGSERISGRNPFADPDRLKDTGLHQGGGD